SVRHILHFHPTPEMRMRHLARVDPAGRRMVALPLFAGAFLALVPIQSGLFASDLRKLDPLHPVALWAPTIKWVMSARTIALVLRSEIARIALQATLRKSAALGYFAFCAFLSVGSIVGVLPLLVQSSVLRHRPLGLLVSYASIGGLWESIGYGLAGLSIGY